ncbi:aminoacyl-histidine dipeptidase [soil metagenome]
MNEEIRNLEPKVVWNKFADLNEVPRASKNEERVIGFIKNFAQDLKLESQVDGVGNVIIKKPATPGMENRKGVVLQAHLDMVHQKNNDTDFDFDTRGIEMIIDGDWVKAKGTTLGADNGLGVATMMAILESNSIAHPAIEALFTIDEETGMTGAKGLEPDVLKGEILLNLDTEEDDEIGIGCAGGIDVTVAGTYEEEEVSKGTKALKVIVNGLQGGHSGMDIIKGLGNSNKILNRILFKASEDLEMRIAQIKGGGLRNAIPRESDAIVIIDEMQEKALRALLEDEIDDIKTELLMLEPNLKLTIRETEIPPYVMEQGDQDILLKTIYAAHNGTYRMSPEIEGLVETSNNIASVTVNEGKISINCLTRSSLASSKNDLATNLRSVFELGGYDVEFSGEYPGWTPDMDSAILKVLDKLYQDINNEKANIAVCHAGLECGIIGCKYPNMDMISFGPTIRGAHSPDEKASIKSAQKYWNFVLEILKNIPQKN